MAAETSLVRQLKKLAVPQTTLLIPGKIKKSFLFDHRDAAGLDRDIIFAYGTTGLEKLKMINPLFAKFEQSLFSLSYKEFERSVQSDNVNKKLDEKITEFLRMLSPYFLIRAAHEALEWLVYRFHIHLYNADALIASVLPHFQTSVFVRVIQLLNLDDNNRWSWMKSVQKSGVHLEYSALLNHFNSDGGFRKFVCDLAPNILKVYGIDHITVTSPVISFSMLTIYNAVDICDKVTDNLITFLFPYILEGLKSKFSKYIACSYLIIAKIMMKVKLSDTLVSELLLKVFENVQPDLLEEAFKLLLLIYQQQGLKTIPKRLFSFLRSERGTLKYFEHLSENYETSSLLHAFIKKSVPTLFKLQQNKSASNKGKKFFRFFKSILNGVELNEKCIILLFNTVLKFYLKYLAKKQDTYAKKSLKVSAKYLLKLIETKYPEYFDKAISSFLSKKKKNNKYVCKLINDSVCSVKYKMLPDVKTCLVLGLNHVNSKIRKNAVQYVLKNSKLENSSDQEFISNSVYERLFDNSPDVVMEVLSCSKFLLQWLEKQKIHTAFEHILRKEIGRKSEWYPVQMLCLDILCSSFDGTLQESFDLLWTLLPFLFPIKRTVLKGFIKILNSSVCDILPIFQIVKSSKMIDIGHEKHINDENLIHLNSTVISCAKEYVDKLDQSAKASFLSFLNQKALSVKCNSLLVIYSFILGHAILSEKNMEQKFILVQNLLSLLKYILCNTRLHLITFDQCTSEYTILNNSFTFLLNDQFPSSLIGFAFLNAIKSMSLKLDDLDYNHWPNNNNDALKILNLLFEFCIVRMNSLKGLLSECFEILLSEFIHVHFSDVKYFFWFLSQYWCNFYERNTLVVQLASIKITETYFHQSLEMDWFFDSYVPFISIIKAVVSPVEHVREAALNVLASVLQNSKNCEYALKFLAEDICMNSAEIKIDLRQCYYVIDNWLTPAIENSNRQISKLSPRLSVLESFLKIMSDNLTPYDIKYFILLSLEKIDSVNLLTAYTPVLSHFLEQLKAGKESTNGLLLNIIELLLNKYTPKTASCLVDKKMETIILFECLQCVINKTQQETIDVETDDRVIRQPAKDRSVQLLTLKVITKEFFSSIPSSSVQQKLLNILVDLYITATPDINSAVGKVLRKLCTYAHLILKDFQTAELVASKGTSLKEMKKCKIKENMLSENSDELNKGPWKKIIVLLEIIQNKSKLEKRELLIPELFQLLNKSLNFDNSASVEYLRQLILSTIYNCCQELGTNGLDERQFQVELIVQCIRSSTNPKTHNESLLLLNLAASMFPEYVLSNVMSIFTFMGSSLVRQDDSYSFQVISQTIETIVPSLLAASSHQEESEAVQVVAAVIRVFVESLSDIPGHRQLPLFTKLITTLDPSKYLWIPLGQICDQYATVFHNITSEDIDNWRIAPTLEFAVNLHKQFPPSVQMDTCIKLINFLVTLPDSKEDMETNTEVISKFKEPFNVIGHTDKQLQVYKHNVLSYINIWLSSQAFVSQVSELDLKAQYSLEEKYELLLEATLNYLQHQLNVNKLNVNDQRSASNLIPLLYDLVSHINSLLPCNLFIRVVRGLLRNTDLIIQKNAIELLITKLEQHNLFSDENHESLLKLLKPLVKIVKMYVGVEKSELVNSVVNQQTALYSLHLLAKVIGHKYPLKFFKVLQITVKILSDKQSEPELAINALLCLAQLCNCLNVKVLLQLNSFMPIIVDLLNDDKTINLNECLVISIITALQSLIENIGQFLSSYMQSLVAGICKLAVKYSEKKAIHEKLHDLRCLLAKEISLRVLLSAVENGYTKLSSENKNAVIPLMDIFEEKLNCCKYEDIEACSPQLQKFYISLLDFRNSNSSCPPELVESIEESIISCLKTFVLKLSVTRFRTFFQKVYQWATSTDEKEQKFRIYTFYRLTCELSQSLKSLFVLMAKYFLRHAATILDRNNSTKTDGNYFEANAIMSSQLLNYILDTLTFSFLYDDGQLLDKENFEILMQPLVDQLENIYDDVLYQEMVENHLSTCIARCMTAVSDNALWKKLNYQILLKTRHDSPKVRFAALQIIREIVQKMGDNYLVLLPESIPFLAEIMEDESFEVEQECQSVIIEMEKILGEPIRKYF